MIKNHLTGILNAIVSGVTNARIEGLNTKIQWLKRSARGFRSRERFRRTIYFHLGGLDLYLEVFTTRIPEEPVYVAATVIQHARRIWVKISQSHRFCKEILLAHS